jgi:soluble lytic murein transglycosylase
MAAAGAMKRRVKRGNKHKAKSKKPLVIAAALIIIIAFTIGAYMRGRDYITYPLRYRELIEAYSAEFSLEPAHVAAVILCESGFREKAVSADGARGLMQIIPPTGEWIAGKFGDGADFDPDDLFAPEYNIKLGCWYLSWLMDRYGGDMRSATAAYHAGQGKVDQWLTDSSLSDDGATLKTIPRTNSETAKYTKRVLTAYEKYKELNYFSSGAYPAVGLRAELEYHVASSNRHIWRGRDHCRSGADREPL